MNCKLFSKEIARGIFRISDAIHGPNEDGDSDAPGKATQNAYLVVGKLSAALIDLAVDTPELYAFAEKLAGKPVSVLLTHGHPDHIYHLDTVPEVFLHPADHVLVSKGIPGVCAPVRSVSLRPLADGQFIDLGGRALEVIALPGHTLGSVLFMDGSTGTLLTGDTCARRLLYGLTPTVPLEEHCSCLERLLERDFSVIYTAHDRCGLPKEYVHTILHCIRDELPKVNQTISLPEFGELRNLHRGAENTLNYFDMAVAAQYLPENRTLRISRLSALSRNNPIGIDEQPDFSWMLQSSEQNVVQKAYRIVVRTDNTTVWDSGLIESSAQSFIPYEGDELKGNTHYVWQVTVWDCFGNVCLGEGAFETAFVSCGHWKAQWIESRFKRSETSCEPFWALKPPVWFGKAFCVDGAVKRARLFATAHGIYRAYLNGMRPDDREFCPEHTVYEKILYYQTYQVDHLLKQGGNQLTFYVADGWYFCPQTRQQIKGDTDRPAVLFQLEIEYQDGRQQTVFSDGNESCFTGNVVYADLFLGEKQDFTQPEGKKHPVYLGDFSMQNLVAQPMEPVRPVALLPATRAYVSLAEEWIVDFGQIVCGRARVRIDAPRGAVVTFEYFEITNRAGEYLNTMIAPQKDVYVSDGAPRIYEAAFTFHGFRYIRVTGIDIVRKEDFTAVVLSTEKESLAEFSCSDKRLNRLYQNIRWSQLNNMLSIPTDCPSREKGGFTGDMQIFAKTALLNEQMTPFLTSWLANLAAAQAENGAVPITVPETAPYKRLMITNAREFGDEWPVGVAGWSDAAVLVPYAMYLATGNTRILERQYDSMTRWCEYILKTARNRRGDPTLPEETDKYLWNTGFHFGEWLIPSDKRAITHREACEGSAFYTAPIFGYISLSTMAKIALVLNKSDAAYYRDNADRMKEAIQKALIKGKRLVADTMGAYVLTLAFDLVPAECIETCGRVLISLLEKNHGCLDTGFLATPYLLDAFTKIGRRDLAISLLWQTKQPSWLYEVEHGATAIWESWDAITPDAEPSTTSYDHYAFGCVDAWIFEHVAGVRALESGFRRIEIAPEPDGLPLEFCDRSFLCEYGTVRVFWNREILKVSIPCGTSALVRWKGAEYRVGSGDYVF